MDSQALTRLERCLRNLPILSVDDMVVTETVHGPLYMAWGRDKNDNYHGMWGCRQIGRPIEFKPDTSLEMVKAVLYTDAMGMVESLFSVDLVHEGSFDA